MNNIMELKCSAVSSNESFARVTVAAFVSQLDPTVDELNEIKTVVSEAVTNAVIHGYKDKEDGFVFIRVELDEERIHLMIQDEGIGMDDVHEARQPMYTSKPEMERSGMGFTIMENFMDEVDISSSPLMGTTVKMTKRLSQRKALCN
ncbi:anti-sigma F factor [Texcoconibacillus texcoconensis]|uniref:Anti-sigma F factor n=1 Tax=Texcoconibacillus texcoconensis TaxID=1095777 RepID=A0A840QNR9_9BACI|nr:anti-sigma F factor [Texcoconibacillus texcoconensis]MBB5172983.1 stage II sporulation protein AB (anti-sigma F factor) [Texcoconibacillus texcoconensis]